MCGVLVDEKQEEKLRKIGVKDSKLIGRKKRNELFSKIKKIVKDYKIIIVEPKEIDKAVEGHDGLNLNWLEAKKSCMIINELNPDKAYIDSPSNNVVKYKNYVRKYIKNKKIELVVEHKADQKFISVSAASILANVTRDSEIMKIKKQIGVDV
ncbi:MAG: ribonuclease HII, partial [Bacteroidetes bacterium]|nr:ribonuclease HII [Bacteroidota bacterium]